MANEVFSLEGKVTVDYSSAEKGLKKISVAAEDVADDLNEVDDAADDAGDAIEDSGESADKADDDFNTWKATLANLAANVITKVIDKCVELAEQVVETGIETESAFAKLETIAGTENIDELTEAMMELSSETGISASELANTAYNAISAGTSAEDAADMVETACKLAKAGFTDTDSALSVLTTSLNSYGDEAGTATEISDSLIQTQNLGVTTIDELASSMGRAISTASAYSIDLNNLESAYVSLTKSGISTEESTTYLSSMFSELGDTGSDVAGVLQSETGKSFTELMDEGYSLGDVLGIIYESLGEDSTAMMNLWSSQEAGKASNAIINQGLDTFNENLETLASSSGTTEEAYSTMADTMETKIDILKTSFENLGLELYENLEPTLSNLVEFATDALIPALEKLMDNMDKILAVIVPLVTALVTFKTAMKISGIISNAVQAFKQFKTAVQASNGVFKAFNATLNANPLILIVTIIATVVSALITLYMTNEDFREKVNNAWEKVKTVVTTVGNAIMAVFNAIKTVITTLVDAITTGFQTAFDVVSNIFTTLANIVQTAWDTITSIIQVAIQLIVNILELAFELITLPFRLIWENCHEQIEAIWNAIANVVQTVLGTIQNIIETVWNAIYNVLSPILTAIQTAVTTVFNAIKTTINTILTAIQTLFSTVWNAIYNVVSTVLNSIKSVITTVFNAIKTAISTVLNAIKSVFSTIWNAIYGVIGPILEKIQSAITGPITAAKETISNILDSILSKFQNIFESAKNVVSGAIEKIKGFFDFDWSLPNLKLPHISIDGSFSLNPPSAPSFSIEWYKKAMEGGMILNSPTIFGYNEATGSYLGGGEAGSETVVGTESLTSLIENTVAEAVASQNAGITTALNTLIGLVEEKFNGVIDCMGYDIVTNDGAILAYYTPKFDKELGLLAKRKGR